MNETATAYAVLELTEAYRHGIKTHWSLRIRCCERRLALSRAVEHFLHLGDGVYSWTGPSMPHMTCQEPFCCRWAISRYRSSLRVESPSAAPGVSSIVLRINAYSPRMRISSGDTSPENTEDEFECLAAHKDV